MKPQANQFGLDSHSTALPLIVVLKYKLQLKQKRVQEALNEQDIKLCKLQKGWLLNWVCVRVDRIHNSELGVETTLFL